MILRLSSLFALLVVSACGSAPKTELDQKRLDPEHAETPFTAREIQRGCPEGRRMRTQITEPGKAPVFQVTEFLGGDDVHARMQGWIEDASGKRTPEEPQPMQAKWLDLQSHASFPAIFTTVSEESIEVPGGPLRLLALQDRAREGRQDLRPALLGSRRSSPARRSSSSASSTASRSRPCSSSRT